MDCVRVTLNSVFLLTFALAFLVIPVQPLASQAPGLPVVPSFGSRGSVNVYVGQQGDLYGGGTELALTGYLPTGPARIGAQIAANFGGTNAVGAGASATFDVAFVADRLTLAGFLGFGYGNIGDGLTCCSGTQWRVPIALAAFLPFGSTQRHGIWVAPRVEIINDAMDSNIATGFQKSTVIGGGISGGIRLSVTPRARLEAAADWLSRSRGDITQFAVGLGLVF